MGGPALLVVCFLLIKNFGQLGSSMIFTVVINFRTHLGFFSAHKKPKQQVASMRTHSTDRREKQWEVVALRTNRAIDDDVVLTSTGGSSLLEL
jgi:hypothetical protein